MKKIFRIVLLLLSIVLLFGCEAKQYKVQLLNDDGTLYKELLVLEEQSVTLDTLTKEGHTFIGWFDGETKVQSPVVFIADKTLVAKFEINQYTYKFVDEDGTVLKEETVDYGSEIVYPSDPTKKSTEKSNYEFKGWDKSDKVIKEDITFTAKFDEVIKKFTYKFYDDKGTVLKEETVEYGTMPTPPTDINLDYETDTHTFKFKGWDPEITEVTKNIEYKPIYELTKKPITSIEGLKVSIIGDSISTFYAADAEMTSYYSAENTFYYPRYSTTIKTSDKTWWSQLIKDNKMVLGINNSWSGTCADDSGERASYSDARVNTIDDNGMPDIVIIYMGTNDWASGKDVSAYKNAIIKTIEKVNKLGNTQIFLTTLGYASYSKGKGTDETLKVYNEEIRKMAEQYDCGLIPLDEYVVDDNYKIYLEDSLHYNAKGATLLSKIFAKHISEYFNIEYKEEIKVEHQEKLPEGVIAKITATTASDFWTKYATDVFLMPFASYVNPQYATRIEIKLNTDTNQYYVHRVVLSGDATKEQCDYVLVVSDAHTESKALSDPLKTIPVGTIVEFSDLGNFPNEILFKEAK